jgi:hypothetical protein
MFRFAALIILTAAIWFTLSDSPAVTGSSGARTAGGAPPRPVVTSREAGVAARAEQQPRAERRRLRKARPRLRITPLYPYRRYHALYPLPYNVEYPGPRGVRHCVNRYVTERRPSGPVVLPKVRCWWTRG